MTRRATVSRRLGLGGDRRTGETSESLVIVPVIMLAAGPKWNGLKLSCVLRLFARRRAARARAYYIIIIIYIL